jgi:hypothetical protein
VTRASRRTAHQVKQGVLLAVDPDLGQFQHVTRRAAFPPELVTRGRPEHRDPLTQRGFHGLLIGVADEQDLAAGSVLQHDRHDLGTGRRDRRKLAEVQGKPGTFLKFAHPLILPVVMPAGYQIPLATRSSRGSMSTG